MHRRVDTALRHLRQDLTDHLDESAVHALCKRLGHVWRDCLLTPCAIVHWLLVQVLHGNTALNHISLQARRAFSDSAYCQARARLPLAVFQAVLRHVTAPLIPATVTEGRWRRNNIRVT